jgi:hypothetical protein
MDDATASQKEDIKGGLISQGIIFLVYPQNDVRNSYSQIFQKKLIIVFHTIFWGLDQSETPS